MQANHAKQEQIHLCTHRSQSVTGEVDGSQGEVLDHDLRQDGSSWLGHLITTQVDLPETMHIHYYSHDLYQD